MNFSGFWLACFHLQRSVIWTSVHIWLWKLHTPIKDDVPDVEEVVSALKQLSHFARRLHPPHQIVDTSAAELRLTPGVCVSVNWATQTHHDSGDGLHRAPDPPHSAPHSFPAKHLDLTEAESSVNLCSVFHVVKVYIDVITVTLGGARVRHLQTPHIITHCV